MKLAVVRSSFLFELFGNKTRICAGGHPHVRLQHGETVKSATYPEQLCTEWASQVRRQYDFERPVLGGEDLAEVCRVRLGEFEKL